MKPIALQYTPKGGRRRRVVLEKSETGTWLRTEQELCQGRWRTAGSEIIEDVELESPAAIVSDRWPETFSGP